MASFVARWGTLEIPDAHQVITWAPDHSNSKILGMHCKLWCFIFQIVKRLYSFWRCLAKRGVNVTFERLALISWCLEHQIFHHYYNAASASLQKMCEENLWSYVTCRLIFFYPCETRMELTHIQFEIVVLETKGYRTSSSCC